MDFMPCIGDKVRLADGTEGVVVVSAQPYFRLRLTRLKGWRSFSMAWAKSHPEVMTISLNRRVHYYEVLERHPRNAT